MQKLKRIILDNEDILMEKILSYAKEQNYTKYTSTLKEAWRMSIVGLSEVIVKMIEKSSDIPKMGPDDDFTKSEVAEFGIVEAQRHRSRGVTLGMFLGLMKYYQQVYIDIIDESHFSYEEKKYFSQYIKRCFDHMELGFTIEWAELCEKEKIEELKEANRRIINEKNKYLTIFESIYDPIILVDEDNKIENINYKAAEIFLSTNAPEMKYYGNVNINTIMSWLSEELIKFSNANRKKVLREMTIETKSGKRTFLVKFKKMLDISEKYRGTVIIFNDITKRIKIESKLKNQHKKLMATQSQMVQSEKMASIGTLVAGIAHEINNPTNYAYLSSKVLQNDIGNFKKDLADLLDGADNEVMDFFEVYLNKFFDSIDIILNGSNQVKNVVNDLKLFSRIDEAVRKEINVSEALKTTVRLVKTQYTKQIEFETDFRTDAKIECYPSQLNQVFLNIIINACQAIIKKQNDLKEETRGLIKISVSSKPKEIEIVFSDNGCGMTEEEKSKIFEPFFTTKPIGEGTGMGMAISYSIIERHNGKIDIKSQAGKGTKTTIVLPYYINSTDLISKVT
ncbi:ATP-binding protein [Clostridium sp.]|uniref:ATP-binding protein n=1 Tax=Clostridium sp. TaxID=1506 RepID=UPI002841B5C1|nr:ATP-binding protein [Clostridium sp.]MDR3594776.1 ATP-binding protein [Clostridium sp.]